MIKDIQAQSEARCERLESASKLIEEPLAGDRCRVTEAFVKQALEISESRGDERRHVPRSSDANGATEWYVSAWCWK